MPATTNNDTLLKAFNQTIQALLDMNVGGDCPDVTVNVPAPVVNVYNTVKCSCSCTQSSQNGGNWTQPEPVDDTPLIPDPDTGIDAAKCKRVNFVIDKYIDFMGLWDAAYGLLAIGPGEMYAAWLMGIDSVIGGFATMLAAGFALVLFGYVIAMFVGGMVALAYITAHLVSVKNNRKDWVCAMYNATSPSELKQAIIDFLGDNLAGLPQAFVNYHVDALFTTSVLNFIVTGDVPSGISSDFASYSIPSGYDCTGCGGGDGYTWDFSINSKGGTNTNQNAFITSINGIANSYDGGGHWWGIYGSWTTFKLYPGRDLTIPGGTIIKIWWENAEQSAQGVFEQYQVSQNYGYFPGQAYGGTSPSEVAINRDWTTSEIFLTPTLGALRITKIVIVGVH